MQERLNLRTRLRQGFIATIITAVIGGVVGAVVHAQLGAGNDGTPEVITYRGYLEDSSTGTAVAVNGQRTMTFAIYSVASGGSALWTCSNQTVTVVGGNFEFLLGDPSVNCAFPTGLFANPTRYLEVSVSGVTLGRQRITAAPYALTAAQAQKFTVNGLLTANAGVTVKGGSLGVTNGSSTTTVSATGISAGSVTSGGISVTNGAATTSISPTNVSTSSLSVTNGLPITPSNQIGVSGTNNDMSLSAPVDGRHYCFVTGYGFVDGSSGIQECYVWNNGGNWYGHVTGSNASDWCNFACLSW